jgi:hypothetical protein
MTLLKTSFDDQVLEAQIPLILDSYTNFEVPVGEAAQIYIGSSANLTNAGVITVGGDLLVQTDGSVISNTGTISVTGVLKIKDV